MTPDEINKNWISIHTLRGEGDIKNQGAVDASVKISIHTLRGEGDYVVGCYKIFGNVFQSTPSVGRATISPHAHAHER